MGGGAHVHGSVVCSLTVKLCANVLLALRCHCYLLLDHLTLCHSALLLCRNERSWHIPSSWTSHPCLRAEGEVQPR